jgi:hypothetical protein
MVEQEIKAIKERNARVEADKAWEVSTFRISTICIITYIVAALVLCVIHTHRWWLNALIPTIGFYLSTRSLAIIKKWWIKSRYQLMDHENQ